jgi:hypothetical protein
MKLIKNIEASLAENYTGSILFIKSVNGKIQQEDYINLNSFTAYLQNLTKVEKTYGLKNPLIYGLRNQNNISTTTLEINY